jgi:hypothetical protein
MATEDVNHDDDLDTDPSDDTTDPANAPVTAGQLGALVESIQAMTPKRKVLFSELKPKSPFNPKGVRHRKLARTVLQNGNRLNVKQLFDEEIRLLNELRPGIYVNKKVSVHLIEGTEGNVDTLLINYKNKTHDDRLAMKEEVRSFVALLRRIVDESKDIKVAAR